MSHLLMGRTQPRSQTWALVGSESLLGRELRDLIAVGHVPVDLKLISEDPEKAGALTEQGGEPALVRGLEEPTMRDAPVVLLAGSAESTLRALVHPGALCGACRIPRAGRCRTPDCASGSHRHRDGAAAPACPVSGPAVRDPYFRAGQRARHAGSGGVAAADGRSIVVQEHAEKNLRRATQL